jgi:hypothetical protein
MKLLKTLLCTLPFLGMMGLAHCEEYKDFEITSDTAAYDYGADLRFDDESCKKQPCCLGIEGSAVYYVVNGHIKEAKKICWSDSSQFQIAVPTDTTPVPDIAPPPCTHYTDQGCTDDENKKGNQ